MPELNDRHNVIPVFLAVILHVVVFGSLFVAFDFSRSAPLAVPLAIKGSLVTADSMITPPAVVEAPPKPVEPPPKPVEPPPDTQEQERKAAEEEKRREDARVEKQRLQRIEKERQEREAEQKRQQEAAERQRLADAEKRRQQDEADKERQRVAAERAREEEIERQRAENERQRREAEADARSEELDAETSRLAAVDAGELAAYRFALQQKVERNWVKPASSPADLQCEVRVQQLPGGDVVTVSILTCNGDAAVRRSIEAAIHKASPLPTPRNPNLFDRNLRFTFRPEQ